MRSPPWRTLLSWAGAACTAAAAALIVAWLAGRVVSDRFAWSQWFLWIPTPVALLSALLAVAASLRPAPRARVRSRRIIIAGAVAMLVGAWLIAVDGRIGPRPAPGGLRLVHWTMNHAKGDSFPAVNQAIIDLDADLAVLTYPGPLEGYGPLVASLGEGGRATSCGQFLLFSRLEVVEARPLVAAEAADIALFRVDATEALGRALVIYVVDLPSDPWRPRAELARFLRRQLDGLAAPAPDIVLGDFNMTRNSAAMRILIPGHTDAYDQAGSGWAGTYPREMPLYHIDHVLLAPWLRATEYAIVDPGAGRHRLQVASVRVQVPPLP